ncbi:MAG TPA: PA2169 family four-helix-bundle protein [Chitinophagaceae bacterium]|nr:PA2169 family four-helix-bundle protein [Chitinophagaceae bacterium]
MKLNEKTSEILNDLIQINNDRIRGYEKASKETESKDSDLRALFDDMASESRRYSNELSQFVQRTGDEPAEGTTMRGKIYRTWMDVKATFSGRDRKAILASCEFGEDAAQRAYEAALSSNAEIPADVRQVIVDQKASLEKSHDRIKAMRDSQPA